MGQCRGWVEQTALYIYVGGTMAILAGAAIHSLLLG